MEFSGSATTIPIRQEDHPDCLDDTYLPAGPTGWYIVLISACRDVGTDKVSFKNAGILISIYTPLLWGRSELSYGVR